MSDESPDSGYFDNWDASSGCAYRVSFNCLAHGAHFIVSGSRIGQVMHRSTPMIQAPRLSVTYRFLVKPFLSLWTTSTYPIHSCAQCSGVICTTPLLPQMCLYFLIPLDVSSPFPSPKGADSLPQASICGWIIRGQEISLCLLRQMWEQA